MVCLGIAGILKVIVSFSLVVFFHFGVAAVAYFYGLRYPSVIGPSPVPSVPHENGSAHQSGPHEN